MSATLQLVNLFAYGQGYGILMHVASTLPTDVTINFPLPSKSRHLQELVLKASEECCDGINIVDFPCRPKAFEICAKFCYGMIVTLNAYNVVVARCAAEYLGMTEDVDRVDPANVTWSYTYNRKLSASDKMAKVGMNCREKIVFVPNDWWVEDLCELDIDLYKRVLTAVKSKERMDGLAIGEALKAYTIRWLPDSVDAFR
ncbi:transmembrane 9 superfamily member 4-like [Hibiscus syriacus]|uniref:Transmembrane 9 superfamily member 4-like n=1 Tax=Hibiscus syriacus TaxID=106335 RepID=A0A6A2WVJ8_HIBSY|nr:transmembrane 9 superfamily member 4-like [Hibiscus syriacus]